MKAKPIAIACVSIALASSLADAASYSFTDLGPGIATAINSSGQVVGHNSSNGFLYSNGNRISLGNSFPSGINSAGLIVGDIAFPDPFSEAVATWANGVWTPLQNPIHPVFVGSYSSSSFSNSGNLINDSGEVTGSGQMIGGPASGSTFLYSSPLNVIDIGNVPNGTDPLPIAINNSGQIVGYTTIPNPTNPSQQIGVPFLYSQGVMSLIPQLEAQNGASGTAISGINDLGQIVGQIGFQPAQGVFNYHGFVFSGGSLTDIGALSGNASSIALGINNHGVIVGLSSLPEHAVVYANGQMSDLNSLVINPVPGMTLTEARAVNDNGQIIGDATAADGSAHAFLLTPVVPEPSSFILAIVGLAALLGYRWRR